MHTSQLSRAWLEVRLAAIVSNARALADRVRPATLCAVVKSNAYGHGLVPVGLALANAGISGLRLAVFTADEGLALRDAGIKARILVLGPIADDAVDAAVRSGLDLALLDREDAARFPTASVVHLKVETGIARFGVQPGEVRSVLQVCERRGLRLDGIYSHLANAEDLDRRFTGEQLERLAAASADAPAGVVRHLAASAAAIMWPQTRLDMVRCGIALYGHWPSATVAAAPESHGLILERALSWRAPVVQTRTIESGDHVGYGCDFVATRPTSIAVLPLGYADGLPRGAGNGALRVKVGHGEAPVIGRICMNACMLDVTDVRPAVRRGDIAEIDIEDVASAAGSIAYEVLARLPESVERRFV